MAHGMTPEETRSFLLDGTRTGKLAVVRADGRPHVTPTWFMLDGKDLVVRITPTHIVARADIAD